MDDGARISDFRIISLDMLCKHVLGRSVAPGALQLPVKESWRSFAELTPATSFGAMDGAGRGSMPTIRPRQLRRTSARIVYPVASRRNRRMGSAHRDILCCTNDLRSWVGIVFRTAPALRAEAIHDPTLS